MGKIRVLIADDHAVLRAGLRLLLNAQPDMEVVGEAGDSQEAVCKARDLRPDVITLDLNMPGGGSIKKIERLRQECPQTRVLVLTMHDDLAYLRAVLAAGGAGYVVKKAADTELMTAIRAVAAGRTFVDLSLTRGQLPTDLNNSSDRPGTAGLSRRERQVLASLGQGQTCQAIADGLSLSVKTVETYRARIAEKLGLKTRADFVRYAAETGLLTFSPVGEEDAKEPPRKP